MVVKPMDEVLGSCHHEAELAALRAALAAFTPHGMRDVRALWANGEVCRECSHALCERFREAQESALGNLAKYLRFAKELADAHAALTVADEMADEILMEQSPGSILGKIAVRFHEGRE